VGEQSCERVVLQQVERSVTKAPNVEELVSSAPEPQEMPGRIGVRSAGKIQFVNVGEIDWIQGARNYAEIHAGQQAFLLRETLESLQARLPAQFLRVSKSAFVNVDRIKELRPKSHGDSIVVLNNGTKVTATRTYRESLKRKLGL
jgi:two-component system LytT family response regulator